MNKFNYAKVINGREIVLPWLQEETENIFPNHQAIINQILWHRGHITGWRIRIKPNENIQHGQAIIAFGINLIVLSMATKEEMVLTLLHEIAHYLKRADNNILLNKRKRTEYEIEIEKTALAWFGRENSWYLQKLENELIEMGQ